MMSNKKRWQDDLSLIIFPLLVAIYPILFLFVGNIHKLELSVLELPVLITLSVVLVSVLILNLVIKDMTRSSLLVTMVVIFFFVYGRLSTPHRKYISRKVTTQRLPGFPLYHPVVALFTLRLDTQ